MTQRPIAIIAQGDRVSAAELTAALQPHCQVFTAQSADDVRHAVPQHRAGIVIADLETFDLARVRELRDQFGGVQIVCLHRLADEELWAQALAAGADDCCDSRDITGILRSALRNVQLARGKAA